MTSESKAVTIIGLGDMGAALADAALERGYGVSIWNRSAGKAKDLEAKGAETVPDLESALSRMSAKVLCVSDHNATMDLLDNDTASAAAKGRTLIQLSTVTSRESRSLFDWAERAQVNYMDGQILSYPDDMLTGRGTIVCSGDKELFEENRALLTDLAGNALHVGDRIGAAPAFDKAHLAWAMGNYFAFLQAAAMCQKSGVDLNAWCKHNLQYLASGDAAREFGILTEQVCSRTYEEGFDASLDVWGHAIDKTVEEFESAGMNRTPLTLLQELTTRATELGMGRRELGFIFELMLPNEQDHDRE